MCSSAPCLAAPVPSPALGPGKKNIVLCCDGTGNEFGGSNSNIVKLYTAMKIDNRQVGYYHPGVGTMGDPGARGKLGSLWSRIKGLAFGAGFQANVLDAYRYLMENYNEGDKVWIFGFSRGAYTARALAGLLDGYGLLCRGNEGHIPYAWRLYLAQLKHRSRSSINEGDNFAAGFKETFSHHGFCIHFVGLWDTVSSVGWVTEPLRLYNVAQNRTIQTIRHAIAIDERRCFYVDNLYGKEFDGQSLQQVWFAGAHSDIGGSYPQASSGLSNITLGWMIHHARQNGLDFEEDRVNILFGAPARTYPAVRNLYGEYAACQVHRSLSLAWWLLEFLPHRYYDKDDGKEQYRIPLGSRRELPTGALVHHSVVDRMKDGAANYNPENVPEGTLKLITRASVSEPQLYCYEPKKDLSSGTTRRRLTVATFVAVELTAALWVSLKFALFVRRSLPAAWAGTYSGARRLDEWVHAAGPLLTKLHLKP